MLLYESALQEDYEMKIGQNNKPYITNQKE